jgi:LacI family transcriptional regulator
MAEENSSGIEIKPQTRSTLKDVAAIAGVSIKTASRALGGESGVNKETQARVEDAAKKLNYRPNKLAQQLRAGNRTHAIALLVGELSNPFYSAIASGIESVVRPLGFDLLIASTDEEQEQEKHLIEGFIERAVEGFLVVTSSNNHFHLESERERGTPIVFIDRPPVNLLADSITLDNKKAVYLALDYLFKNKCKRIAVLTDSLSVWTASERVTAVGDYYLEKSEAFDNSLIFSSQASPEIAANTTEKLLSLEGSKRPEAILATNNQISLGVIAGMKKAKVALPLVGIDDFDFADVLGATTVTNNPLQLGVKSAAMLMDRLKNPKTNPVHIHIEPELIERSLTPSIPGVTAGK